jgi:3-hydroxyisobutyrate dehydrogenase-like beta-hydroxyacid dehydrogenase
MNIGIVGIGIMGNIIGRALIKQGHQLVVHDVRKEAATAMVDIGAIWASSPAETAAGSEIVITSLPTPEAVRTVIMAPIEGVLATLPVNGVVIDMSTSPPSLARELYKECLEVGIHSLDAPLSNRGAYITVGGDQLVFERCLAVFKALADDIFYMGEPGMGHVAKLIRQYVSFGTFVLEAEAMLMATKAGANLETTVEFLRMSIEGPSHLARVWLPILGRDFLSVGAGSLNIIEKDLRLAVGLADELQTPADVGRAASAVFKSGQQKGLGDEQWYKVITVLEDSAGATVQR